MMPELIMMCQVIHLYPPYFDFSGISVTVGIPVSILTMYNNNEQLLLSNYQLYSVGNHLKKRVAGKKLVYRILKKKTNFLEGSLKNESNTRRQTQKLKQALQRRLGVYNKKKTPESGVIRKALLPWSICYQGVDAKKTTNMALKSVASIKHLEDVIEEFVDEETGLCFGADRKLQKN